MRGCLNPCIFEWACLGTDRIRRHRYALALHTHEPHRHAHVVVKAMTEDWVISEHDNRCREASGVARPGDLVSYCRTFWQPMHDH
jgi:hypothetical protein